MGTEVRCDQEISRSIKAIGSILRLEINILDLNLLCTKFMLDKRRALVTEIRFLKNLPNEH